MALTITDSFLDEVKRYIRVSHSLDDQIIKTEIEVATEIVYETLCLIPKTITSDDGTTSANSDFPASTDNFTIKKKSAIIRLVATFRQNPDDHLESRNIPYNKRLIERVLGSELGYPSV